MFSYCLISSTAHFIIYPQQVCNRIRIFFTSKLKKTIHGYFIIFVTRSGAFYTVTAPKSWCWYFEKALIFENIYHKEFPAILNLHTSLENLFISRSRCYESEQKSDE